MKKLFFFGPVLLADTEVVQHGAEVLAGIKDVLTGAEVPMTSRALGELLGWMLLTLLLRAFYKLRQRFAPVQQTTTVVVQQPAGAEPAKISADPAEAA